MDPIKERLQAILDALPSGQWDNPYIFSYDEEYWVVYTLVATKPGIKDLYYYEPDEGSFQPLNLPWPSGNLFSVGVVSHR